MFASCLASASRGATLHAAQTRCTQPEAQTPSGGGQSARADRRRRNAHPRGSWLVTATRGRDENLGNSARSDRLAVFVHGGWLAELARGSTRPARKCWTSRAAPAARSAPRHSRSACEYARLAGSLRSPRGAETMPPVPSRAGGFPPVGSTQASGLLCVADADRLASQNVPIGTIPIRICLTGARSAFQKMPIRNADRSADRHIKDS